MEADQKSINVALFSKIEDGGKVVDVYFVPIDEGGTQSIVGKTKESVPDVFLWKREEVTEFSNILPVNTSYHEKYCTIL